MFDFGENIIEFLENQGDELVNTYKETYQLPPLDETLDLDALLGCDASLNEVQPSPREVQESISSPTYQKSETCQLGMPIEFLENQEDASINTYKEIYQLPTLDEALDLAALLESGASLNEVQPGPSEVQESRSSPTCQLEVPIEFLENQGDQLINTYKETYQLPPVDETLDGASLNEVQPSPSEVKVQESISSPTCQESETCQLEVPSEALVTKITKQLWEAPKTEKLLNFVLIKEMNRKVQKIMNEHWTRGRFRFFSDFKSKLRFVLRYRPY